MIRLILMREVSYRGEAVGWVQVWYWAHENLPYYTDASPNNKFMIPLSH